MLVWFINGLDQNILDKIVQNIIMRIGYGQSDELGSKFGGKNLVDILWIEDYDCSDQFQISAN